MDNQLKRRLKNLLLPDTKLIKDTYHAKNKGR